MRRIAFSMLMVVPVMVALVITAGCPAPTNNPGGGGGADEDAPSFTLAWSEYPSWSAFGAASDLGLIDGEEGGMGPIEIKHGVDIVLKEADYDTCLQLYGSGTVDAVCITNMDVLAPSLQRSSVAVLPTSTSRGADACITIGINTVEDLKGVDTFGLDNSVSQYCFERCLEEVGMSPEEFPFVSKDPAAAATALQLESDGVKSIMVWNPFVLQTLKKQSKAAVLFDSTAIPEEIIDMVVVDKASLGKAGGDKFAAAVAETFYELCNMMEDPETQDDTLLAISERFGNLTVEDMKVIVDQTRFYKTPAEAKSLFEGDKFQSKTMPLVVEFCASHGMVTEKPTVGFGDEAAQVNFSTQFLEAAGE